MNDLVVGLGEIGKPIFQLLKNRNFKVDGYDILGKNSTPKLVDKYDVIHICYPYSEKFIEDCNQYWKWRTENLVIHSTVKPGTSKKLGAIYSPVRGTHNDMLENLQWFAKFYSGEINIEFEKRFPNCIRVDDSTKLERTKIIDTTYYGLLMAFRKYVDEHHPIYWPFEYELHQRYGNRPTLYNDEKPIGGHCIIENLDLLEDKFLGDFIRRYKLVNNYLFFQIGICWH